MRSASSAATRKANALRSTSEAASLIGLPASLARIVAISSTRAKRPRPTPPQDCRALVARERRQLRLDRKGCRDCTFVLVRARHRGHVDNLAIRRIGHRELLVAADPLACHEDRTAGF